MSFSLSLSLVAVDLDLAASVRGVGSFAVLAGVRAGELGAVIMVSASSCSSPMMRSGLMYSMLMVLLW